MFLTHHLKTKTLAAKSSMEIFNTNVKVHTNVKMKANLEINSSSVCLQIQPKTLYQQNRQLFTVQLQSSVSTGNVYKYCVTPDQLLFQSFQKKITNCIIPYQVATNFLSKAGLSVLPLQKKLRLAYNLFCGKNGQGYSQPQPILNSTRGLQSHIFATVE